MVLVVATKAPEMLGPALVIGWSLLGWTFVAVLLYALMAMPMGRPVLVVLASYADGQ